MKTPNFLEKTTPDTINEILDYENFPVPIKFNSYADEYHVGLSLEADSSNDLLTGVQVIAVGDVDSLTIKVVINTTDIDNSVTANFNHKFIDGLNLTIPIAAISDARTFLHGLCENYNQAKAMDTVLYAKVGERLFGDVSLLPLIRQTLVKIMVENDL
jgi:hypothetical protein